MLLLATWAKINKNLIPAPDHVKSVGRKELALFFGLSNRAPAWGSQSLKDPLWPLSNHSPWPRGHAHPEPCPPALGHALDALDPQILCPAGCELALEPAGASSQVCLPEKRVSVHALRLPGGTGGAVCEGGLNGAVGRMPTCMCESPRPGTWGKPKGKRRGQTMDGDQRSNLPMLPCSEATVTRVQTQKC